MSDIYRFVDEGFVPDPVWEYPTDLREQRVPLIIDNGSYTCKAGWACDAKPRLIFRNLIAKTRVKREGDISRTLIGNDIVNLESMKWTLKTQFDKDVVTHFDAQEQIFDYLFSHLGINTDGHIGHPIVLTEGLCNPNSSRQFMSELLFECYGIPQVSYGVDCLYSYHHNLANVKDGLILSSGHQTSHIVPVVNGKLDVLNARRVIEIYKRQDNMVSSMCLEFGCTKANIVRLLGGWRINLGGMNGVAFMQRLLQMKHPGHSAVVTLSRAQELVHKFTYMAGNYDEELSKWVDDEFANKYTTVVQLPYVQTQNVPVVKDLEKEKEKKIQQGKRLKELNARKREEKLAQDEERYQSIMEIQQLKNIDPGSYKVQLQKAGFNTVQELQAELKELFTSIKSRREKILQLQTQQQDDEEGGKEKTQNDKVSLTEGMSEAEIENWLIGLREERKKIQEKRRIRHQRKQELSNRKSHASKERMRILTELAASGKSSRSQKKQKEDTFGMNDDDWEVYKYISKGGSDSESEQEQERLNELDNILNEYDPEFKSTKVSPENVQDLSIYYQLHLDVERTRIPEIVYQPSLLGSEQAGIGETIDYVLKKYPAQVQNRLVQHVFVTGGNTKCVGFQERLEKELLAMRPFQSTFKVFMAADPVLDAWHGARQWVANTPDLTAVFMTRADYEECGGEYLKEHLASNFYVPTPRV